MANECMLTTVDNPYNPFTDFTSWYSFDMEKGYDCCGRIGRLVNFSDELTSKEELEDFEHVIDEIIKYDDADIYIKVYENSERYNKTDNIDYNDGQNTDNLG